MNISSSLKTKLYTEIANGNIVYSPSAPFTYGSWSGMVYITFDPITGSGSYVIGEGLNGGYTVNQLISMWKDLFANNKAYTTEYTLDIPQLQIRQGGDLIYTVNYIFKYLGSVIGSFFETNKVNTTDLPPGPYPIKPKYNAIPATLPQPVPVVNTKCYFGTEHCEYDDEIKTYATQDIDGDLIKSVIKQESVFNPNAIRYEIHTDYNWYSKLDNAEPQREGWRGIDGFPEKHWRLAGHNVPGENFTKGDQVRNMEIDIYQRLSSDSTPKLIVAKDDTAQIVVNKNPARGWTTLPSNLNYTAQLILASSYGLMQTLYDTARWNTFEYSNSPARDVEDLFITDVNIKVGVHTLQYYYNLTNSTLPKEQRIKKTLTNYNGDLSGSYANEVWKTYQSTLYDKIQ